MKRSTLKALAAALLLSTGMSAQAQDFLIKNATVHTATAQGTLQNSDVLISGGVIRAVGKGLLATPNAQVIDAQGRPLTPTLFGGITEIGLEEVSGEKATVDTSVALGAATKQMSVRPEFDVTLAYNPDSVLLPVERIEGIGWTLLGANSTEGGSIIGGQGGVVRLDGSPDPIGPRVLFVNLGSDASGLTGNSRAAQWMLLDQ
ncbi:MAG TPA: amidohydrolase, partial [Lysobacter sp.]